MEDFSLFGLDASTLALYGIEAITVLIAFAILLIVAGWVKNLVSTTLTKAKLDVTLAKFFSNLARYAVLIMGILGILEKFGFETTSFAAIIGAAGLAVGLAFQGTLSNFSAGVMLLVFRPFKVGDVVSVAGITGAVVEIDLFVVHFDTPDNRRIILPNSSIVGSTIENITFHGTRRVEVNVGTDYSDDLSQVSDVLVAAANSVKTRLQEPAPDAYLLDLGDSCINWVVRVWVNNNMDDYLAARQELTYNVKNALDAANLNIPYPQMDVHVDGKLGE